MDDEIKEIFHREVRHESEHLSYRREETATVVRSVSLTKAPGYILCSHLTASNAVAAIEEELAYFASLHQPFEWIVFDHDEPSHLGKLLISAGFEAAEPETVMIYALGENRSWLGPRASLVVEELVGEDKIEEVIALEESVWKRSFRDLQDRLQHDMAGGDNFLRLYGVRDHGKLVSAAWMYCSVNSRFASLWGGATLPEFRGKGAYHALVAARAHEALKLGRRWLSVDAGPMSQPILEKLGFFVFAVSRGYHPPTR